MPERDSAGRLALRPLRPARRMNLRHSQHQPARQFAEKAHRMSHRAPLRYLLLLALTPSFLSAQSAPVRPPSSATPTSPPSPASRKNSSPSPMPNWPASTSRSSPPSPIWPPRLKTARPPNMSRRSSAPPASKPKSSPTASSSTSPKSSASKPMTPAASCS